MSNKTLFISSAAVLLLVFAAGTVVYKRGKAKKAAQITEDNQGPFVRNHAPMIGRADAPVVIVEFFDPACETCAAFYPLVKGIMAENPDKIRLVLRYAPFHDGSDKVVALLEAARRQDKFWPVLEALLATQSAWAPHHTPQLDLVWYQLAGLGLNLEKLRADMSDPEIANLVLKDVEDARTLNVTKTPSFFVNGRPLPGFGHAPLKMMVDDAIKRRF